MARTTPSMLSSVPSPIGTVRISGWRRKIGCGLRNGSLAGSDPSPAPKLGVLSEGGDSLKLLVAADKPGHSDAARSDPDDWPNAAAAASDHPATRTRT